jgi:hypothetical protein
LSDAAPRSVDPAPPRAPPGREIAVAGVALGLVGVGAFGQSWRRGGFYSDDWGNAAVYANRGYAGLVHDAHASLGARPILALLLPLPHALFGLNAGAQGAFGVLLGVVACATFYVFLRTLRVDPGTAIVVAALALIFPWADSVRLWPTASVNNVAVILYFAGASVGLRYAGRRGREGLLLHLSALLLFVLSILTYETASVAICLTGALYFARTTRRRAASLWGLDVAVATLILVWSAATTRDVRHVATPANVVSDVPRFIREGGTLLTDAILAFPGTDELRVVQIVVLLGVVAAIGGAARAARAGDPECAYWLRFTLVAATGVVAAFVVALGSTLHPLDPGTANRVNLFAAYGYAALSYGLVAVACSVLPLRRHAVWTVTLVLVIATGWFLRVRQDERHWARAAQLQRNVLHQVGAEIRGLPPGSTVLAVAFPAETAPNVPVFAETWDLLGALQIHVSRRIRAAYPIAPHVRVRCLRNGLRITGPGDYGDNHVAFARTFAVSPTRLARLGTPTECRSFTARGERS